jgi:hypothetical protein
MSVALSVGVRPLIESRSAAMLVDGGTTMG